MSATHVALLRGINVGKAKRVAMADLKKVVENLGHSDVTTLLNSGNVVFTAGRKSAALAAEIEAAIEKQLKVRSRVTTLTAAELRGILGGNPLERIATDPARLMVVVCRAAADLERLDAIRAQKWAPDQIALGARVAYVWCPSKILESPLFAAVTKALGDRATARNWATMTKLGARVFA